MSKKNGRPSLYKPEYCQMIVDHCAAGYSFESFAGKIGVHIDTLHEWCKVHPSFSEAKKMARTRSLYFWERLCLENLENKSFNSVLWIFNMKNRFFWKDVNHEEEKDSKPAASVYMIHGSNKSQPKTS